ncbi:MAG: TetR/AcrR family transcriptional regulator [Saprospirales bacterium]|nr:TetR/AcrR family transcriptional regulator [Saprospirales bacterium]MBK8490977.1 TetR/AcrR family transcriptional regulator [Saprospirales bacterium]
MVTKSSRTRQHIIQQAAALFNQKGYAGTSLQDIMEATGLSKGALYGQFKEGKEEIALAAFEFAVNSVYGMVGVQTRLVDHAVDKLKTVIAFYREHIFTPPVEGGCPIQNTAIEADDNQPVLRARVVEAIQEWKDRIVHTVQKGMEKGEIHDGINPEEFATYFIGSLEGGILLARIQQDRAPFDIMTRPLLERLEEICTDVSR